MGIEAAIKVLVNGLACVFQQHLMDQECASAIADPIGIDRNKPTVGGAKGGIGTGGAIQLVVEAQFHSEAEAIAGKLELQRCKALIKQGWIGASHAEYLLDQGGVTGLAREAGEGLVGPGQGLLPGLLGAIGELQAAAGLQQLPGIEQHVAAPFEPANVIIAGETISSGELGELVHKLSTFAVLFPIAAEDQNVGVRIKRTSPAAQFIGVAGQVRAFEQGIA